MKATLAITLLFFAASSIFAADTAIFEVRSVAETPTLTTKPYALPERKGIIETLNLDSTVLLDHTALKSAAVEKDHPGKPIILIKLTEPGSKRFGDVTESNIGKRLGIIVAGRLLLAPIVAEPIRGGSLQISGNLSEQEASDLAGKLNESIRANAR